MGPLFSPRVPYYRATGLALAARQLLARAASLRLRQTIQYFCVLLLLILLSTSIILARTPAEIQFHPLTFWALYKWYVVVAVAAFLIQTFLITRLLLMQSRGRQAEEKFAKSFKSNPQPISLTRVVDGLYVDVNDTFVAMSGYKREEVIGHTSLELNIWETPDHRARFIQRLNDFGSVVNFETRFRTKEGSFRVLLSSAEMFEVSGEECLLVVSSDITERMATQQALKESEERFRTMADNSPVMIWVSAADSSCTYVNNRWCEFTGRTMQQELGNGWTESIHPEDRDRSFAVYENCVAERKPFAVEYRLRRYDGEYRWIYDTGAARFSPDGEFLGFTGSCIDITERMQSVEELQKAHDELSLLKNQLEAENVYLQQELQLDPTFGEIVGQSDAIKYVLFKVTQVAPT